VLPPLYPSAAPLTYSLRRDDSELTNIVDAVTA
jgi:hypothetical protein